MIQLRDIQRRESERENAERSTGWEESRKGWLRRKFLECVYNMVSTSQGDFSAGRGRGYICNGTGRETNPI